MLELFGRQNDFFRKIEKKLMHEDFGVIQRLGRFYPELHVNNMYHYYSYMCDTKAFCDQSNIRYGKGVATSPERAMLKAIGEGIERYCSAIYKKDNFPLLSSKEINIPFLSPEKINLYTENFYNMHPKYSRFLETTKIRWVKGKNLRTGIQTLLPAAMSYFPYYVSSEEEKIIQNISTGLAFHVSYESAAINAICEVIERDAFMIFWRNKLPPPRIEKESLPTFIKTILELYDQQGLKIDLFNLTTDLRIPVILAVMESSRNIMTPIF